MNLMENLRLALEGLRANKMRALLTMLGIIIGIASVIAILTVGDGLSGTITNSMGSLGASNIMVTLQQRDVNERSYSSPNEEDLISDDMLDALMERYANEISGISLAESAGSGQAQDGRLYANVTMAGVNEDYLSVNNIDILQGRNINERDMDGSRNVAVVSDKFVSNMFRGNNRDALGKEIKVRVNNEIHVFSIIGVYEYEQTMFNMSFASDKDISTELYIPLTTSKRITGSDDGYRNVTIQARSSEDSAAFAEVAANFINRFYEDNDRYRVMAISMESITDQMNSIMSTVSLGLSIIAGISLIVGGIGVMNIMLVSVTERTREIGTRKALGATNSNIRIQFVVESIIVCLVGGAIGVVLGSLLGYLGSSLIDVGAWPQPYAIAIAVGFSVAIGVFFGYYPANKAARLDPIEALRYE
ncbi:ABC transporter permease [Christensenellaceae bacterium OttesenSCG-928-M15]|nr:ABC transporter permease [Christensenellaceae bacterium OttesenSCG-928-M15]